MLVFRSDFAFFNPPPSMLLIFGCKSLNPFRSVFSCAIASKNRLNESLFVFFGSVGPRGVGFWILVALGVASRDWEMEWKSN